MISPRRSLYCTRPNARFYFWQEEAFEDLP